MPVKEPLSASQYATRDYVEEQKKRILREKKSKHKY